MSFANKLKEIGFKGKSLTYRRYTPYGVDCVICEKRSFDESITVGFGSYISRIYSTVWQKSVPNNPISSEATIHARAGLIIDGYDRWYGSDLDAIPIVNELMRAINDFFDCDDDAQCLIRKFELYPWMMQSPPDQLSFACILWESGRRKESLSIVEKVSVSRSKYWSARAISLISVIRNMEADHVNFPLSLSS